jgi:pimeloyl-ACP methyl ester carboxylesterase
MKRLLSTVTVAGLLLSALTALAPSAAAASSNPAVTKGSITWGTCDDPDLADAGAVCAQLAVPLDYAHPGGAKISLAVSMVRHTVPDADYQGVMLVNPGGPGGSGLGLATLGQAVPDGAGDFYDWIGFDPRGVGASKPALSCIPDYGGYNRPEYDPAKAPGVVAAWQSRAARYAAACASKGGALLSHLTTEDAAKDLDTIRKALRAKQINFYGFSYGTYLGQVYATLFPQNLRRAVFDGVVDHRGVWYRNNLDQDVAFQKTIEVYFDWIAKNNGVYHLGSSGADIEKLYYAERDKLRAKPAAGKIGPSEWTDIFLQAGYYVSGWEKIATTFAKWVQKRDAAALVALYDDTASIGDDNGYAIYLAVQCTDTAWPQPFAKVLADNTRVAATAPFETWGNAWYNAPCQTWKAPARRPVTITGAGAPPMLLISETLDAATPYSGALEARRVFGKSVLVEGLGGTTHAGSLSGVACTDNAIAAYLTDGTLPARVAGNRSDKQCPAVPQPTPN